MKNIRIYTAPKYATDSYEEVETNIYKTYIVPSSEPSYVTSILFEQEPQYEENEPSDAFISQYPLEDLLDQFHCECLDFYEKENAADLSNAYLEIASSDIEDIRNILSIVGKHVYNREDGKYVKLVIE